MAARFGLFGETRDSLASNSFYSWFQLEPAGEPAAGQCDFRPTGSSFHGLILLEAGVDARGHLWRLTLKIARGFIDDPRQNAFARDIVKSFIDGVAGEDHEQVVALVQDIFQRDLEGPVITQGPMPELTGAPEPGYLVFRGQEDAWSVNLSQLNLALANMVEADGPILVVSAISFPKEPKSLEERIGEAWKSLLGH